MSDEQPCARVLIIEDEPMIMMLLEEILLAAGFQIAGSMKNLDDALAAIDRGAFDVAILDANLRGKSSSPAAEALAARGLPFIVVSGYSSAQREEFAGVPFLQKPFDASQLISALQSVL